MTAPLVWLMPGVARDGRSAEARRRNAWLRCGPPASAYADAGGPQRNHAFRRL